MYLRFFFIYLCVCLCLLLPPVSTLFPYTTLFRSGTSVAVSGMIAFVGLVVPHMIRLRVGANHSWLLPGSALGGACLLLLADTFARTLIAPTEIPVGLFTSLIGGPYFIWLILRHK